MITRKEFLKSDTVRAWLLQFSAEDQSVAVEILEELVFVSSQDFSNNLRKLVLDFLENNSAPIGLYAEREIEGSLFDESSNGVRRAGGECRNFDNLEVGSEGIVAQLITELCRRNKRRSLNHPGPDIIRKNKVHNFILLTDFIGSGDRICRYLDSIWQVYSVKSWHSLKLINFHIFSYASTECGRLRVEKHPLSSAVSFVQACKNIQSLKSEKLKQLCQKYNPINVRALGYKDTGALIVFEHGIPNNTPNIFHKKTKNWQPLFPNRITRGVPSYSFDRESARERFINMKHTRLASSDWFSTARLQEIKLFLVLAALGKKPRLEEAILRKTGLTILEVREAIQKTRENGWVDGTHRLTEKGQREMMARKGGEKKGDKNDIDILSEKFYYPKTLRSPQ